MNVLGPTYGQGWQPVTVAIEDNTNQEVRTYLTWELFEDGWSEYIWADGNFSCDCNRALFFQYAIGIEPNDTNQEQECTHYRYRVCSIVDENGQLLYAEYGEKR